MPGYSYNMTFGAGGELSASYSSTLKDVGGSNTQISLTALPALSGSSNQSGEPTKNSPRPHEQS